MDAPDMQQAGASPFGDAAQKGAGLSSYADASKAGTPYSAASTTGLDSAPHEPQGGPQKRKRILVSRPVYHSVQCPECVWEDVSRAHLSHLCAMLVRRVLAVWSSRTLNNIVI